MLASITIPVYNQNPGLLRRSVQSALQQTEPAEVIVVDDGSDPPVKTLLGPLLGQVRLIEHGENRGISAALNTGIEAATAPWWCWLSSDDEIHPDKVKMQKATLDVSGALASFHSYFKMEDDKGRGSLSVTPIWTSHEHQQRMLTRGCWINGSTVMVHSKLFKELGTFDTSYRYGQDWEMWCRIGERYRWVAVPCGLCKGPVPQPGCPRCYGLGSWPLGVRHVKANLTTRIEADPELRSVRDAEDERIWARYCKPERGQP